MSVSHSIHITCDVGLPPVNYSTNVTAQSQQQMNLVVDTFAVLMGTVFADFKGVTMTCASDLRSELAAAIALRNLEWFGILNFEF